MIVHCREPGDDSWIHVRGPDPTQAEDEASESDEESDSEDTHQEKTGKDLPGLMESWKHLRESGEKINFSKITALAQKHRVTFGKWMVFTDEAIKAEIAWNKIATAIVEERIPSLTAKVSQYDGTGKHVICTYNRDYTNESQVYELERALRSIGIRTRLSYKPDVYTYLGIYVKNEWCVRPTIYASDYYAVDGTSKITRLFEESQAEGD